MSKEGKYILYFLGFLCLVVCIIGLTGSNQKAIKD